MSCLCRTAEFTFIDEFEFLFNSPGSVVAKFRIGWEFKEGIRKAPDPIDKDAVRQRLERKLNLNGGVLGSYHIPLGSIRANRWYTIYIILGY